MMEEVLKRLKTARLTPVHYFMLDDAEASKVDYEMFPLDRIQEDIDMLVILIQARHLFRTLYASALVVAQRELSRALTEAETEYAEERVTGAVQLIVETVGLLDERYIAPLHDLLAERTEL